MTTICPVCKQPPRLDRQGCKPAREYVQHYDEIGEPILPIKAEIVFTEWHNLATCLTPGCPMHTVTLDEVVYQRMSKAEGESYLRGGMK